MISVFFALVRKVVGGAVGASLRRSGLWPDSLALLKLRGGVWALRNGADTRRSINHPTPGPSCGRTAPTVFRCSAPQRRAHSPTHNLAARVQVHHWLRWPRVGLFNGRAPTMLQQGRGYARSGASAAPSTGAQRGESAAGGPARTIYGMARISAIAKRPQPPRGARSAGHPAAQRRGAKVKRRRPHPQPCARLQDRNPAKPNSSWH